MIYLVRHGQTEFNHAHRLQGQRDSALTELGQEQACRMGNHLKPLVDDHERWTITASPLGRTVRTAEIIRKTLGLTCEITLDPRIQEVNCGDWEGFHHHEVEAAAPGAMQQPGWLLRTPGGECYEDISSRLGSFIADIDENDEYHRIVVSHGIAGRILRALYSGVQPDLLWSTPSPPQDAVFRLTGGKAIRIDTREDA